jgi:hypothetical protein
LEQLVVPLSLRQALLQAHHESPTAGHLGIRSTYLRLRERYFWVSMRADVEQWVRSCRLCSARQYSTTFSPGNLQPVLVHYIGQLWAMDVVGPLPITANGNRFILVAVWSTSRVGPKPGPFLQPPRRQSWSVSSI